MRHDVHVTVQQEPTFTRLMVGAFMLLALIVTFWKIVLIGILALSCIGIAYTLRAAYVEQRQGLLDRADQQDRWYLRGDRRGVFGHDYRETDDEANQG